MIYPVNNIAIIQQASKTIYHRGKALDFGWASSHHQWILAVDDGIIYKIEKQKNAHALRGHLKMCDYLIFLHSR